MNAACVRFHTEDAPSRALLAVGLCLALGSLSCRAARAQGAAATLIVNECASGPAGSIELLNRGADPLDLIKDSDTCWYVDDAPGGGAPKLVSDVNLNHAGPSKTCSALQRSSTCAAIAPGEAVWVKYPFINAATGDTCRLLSASRVNGMCVGVLRDSGTSLSTRAIEAGQCFGRQPDGAEWTSGPIACTPGLPNARCVPGAPCDDGNACTRAEVFSDSCQCGAGTPLNGAPCGSGRVCQVGTCGPAPSRTGAIILGQGTSGLLLIGTLVTPDEVVDGEVLIVGDEIRCAGASCQADPAVATASIVQTNGIIFPGLIDATNHVQFDAFDDSDWTPEASDHITNHYQWADKKRYRALAEAKQFLSGESRGARPGIGCELAKFGEIKGLIAGTTSIVGAAIPEDQKCHSSLARTVDQRSNGLSADKIQTAEGFPKTPEADRVCANQGSGKTDAYLVRIGDGTDDIARREFRRLADATSHRGCLLSSKTTIVSGAALQDAELAEMVVHGMSLVWLPKSNITLYGHGTDLSKTANIPAALEKGINVALGTDWSISGSQNLLDELRYADQLDNSQWGDVLSPKVLVQMATKNAARALGLQTVLGELASGHKADLMVIGGDRGRPYDALLAAAPKDIRLVAVGGKIIYGDMALRSLAPAGPACDSLDICGVNKFACVAQSGGDLLNQRYDDLRGKILVETTKYDEKKVTEPLLPTTELCKCAPPADRQAPQSVAQ